MKNILFDLYNDSKGLKTTICVLVTAIYFAFSIYSGANPLEMLIFAMTLLLYIYLPGRLLQQIIQGDRRFSNLSFEMNILLGSGFFCALYCVAMRLDLKILLIFVPVAMSVIFLTINRKNKYSKPSLTPDTWLLVLLFFALLLLYTFSTVTKNALPSEVGDTLINPDILWNIGNANSFTLKFIPEDIRYSGVQLHYHYLTELFAGAISWLTGISAYNIIAFYMQPFMLVCVIKCLYDFGFYYYDDHKKSMFFTFSMFLFGCVGMWTTFLSGRSPFWNDNAYHIITNVNAQTTAVIFLCIFSSMFIQLLDTGFKPSLIQFVLWICSFFMLSFAKGPVAAIVAIGAVITVIWLFVQRKTNIKGLVSAATMGILFFIIYKLFFASGANTSMAFNIWGTLSKTPLGGFLSVFSKGSAPWLIAHILSMAAMVFLIAPLQGFLYYKGLVGDIKNIFRLEGRKLWINSVITGGFLAYFLFNHYAMSQVYFMFLSIFFMHLFAVDELWRLKGKTVKTTAIALGCIAFVTTAFTYTNLIGSGTRFLARNLGIIEKYPYSTVINKDDQAAMEFLKENSSTDALVATNRIHSSDASNNGVSNIYSAFSSRQFYMEGYAYALTNMGVPYYVIDQRKVINEKLFSEETSTEELSCICQNTGITHLVFSSQLKGSEKSIEKAFDKIFDSETVRIYSTGVTPLENHPLYQEELSQYGEGIKN